MACQSTTATPLIRVITPTPTMIDASSGDSLWKNIAIGFMALAILLCAVTLYFRIKNKLLKREVLIHRSSDSNSQPKSDTKSKASNSNSNKKSSPVPVRTNSSFHEKHILNVEPSESFVFEGATVGKDDAASREGEVFEVRQSSNIDIPDLPSENSDDELYGPGAQDTNGNEIECPGAGEMNDKSAASAIPKVCTEPQANKVIAIEGSIDTRAEKNDSNIDLEQLK